MATDGPFSNFVDAYNTTSKTKSDISHVEFDDFLNAMKFNDQSQNNAITRDYNRMFNENYRDTRNDRLALSQQSVVTGDVNNSDAQYKNNITRAENAGRVAYADAVTRGTQDSTPDIYGNAKSQYGASALNSTTNQTRAQALNDFSTKYPNANVGNSFANLNKTNSGQEQHIYDYGTAEQVGAQEGVDPKTLTKVNNVWYVDGKVLIPGSVNKSIVGVKAFQEALLRPPAPTPQGRYEQAISQNPVAQSQIGQSGELPMLNQPQLSGVPDQFARYPSDPLQYQYPGAVRAIGSSTPTPNTPVLSDVNTPRQAESFVTNPSAGSPFAQAQQRMAPILPPSVAGPSQAAVVVIDRQLQNPSLSLAEVGRLRAEKRLVEKGILDTEQRNFYATREVKTQARTALNAARQAYEEELHKQVRGAVPAELRIHYEEIARLEKIVKRRQAEFDKL